MRDLNPFGQRELAHPRARALMGDDSFWDQVDEEAPFGSDEGHEAYFEFRKWRERNPGVNLTDCLSWIMEGELDGYTEELFSDRVVERDLEEPDEAFLAKSYDVFTLDATVIATALAQLLDEGRIDAEAKPYVRVALERQLHPKVVTSDHRRAILMAVKRALESA